MKKILVPGNSPHLFAGMIPGPGFARPHRTLTASCAQAEAIENENCSANTYGKQVVHIAFQRMIGSPFSGAALTGTPATKGGTITVQADWEAKMAAGSTDENKIILIRNIGSSEIPDPNDTTIEGNEVPYGGIFLTDRQRSVTGKLLYVSPSAIAAINVFQKVGAFRMWLIDDKDWVQGGNNGIENVSGIFGIYKRGGLGGAPNSFSFDFKWNNIDEAEFSAAPITFIKGLLNP